MQLFETSFKKPLNNLHIIPKATFSLDYDVERAKSSLVIF